MGADTPDPAALRRSRRNHPGWSATLLPYGHPGRRWAADRHRRLDEEERRLGCAVELFADTLDELSAAVARERARQEPYLQARARRHTGEQPP
ncbi:hypothetical protein ACFQXA_09005 [Nocardiopsis composta]